MKGTVHLTRYLWYFLQRKPWWKDGWLMWQFMDYDSG